MHPSPTTCSIHIHVNTPSNFNAGSLQKHLHAFLVKLLNALKSCQLGLTSTTIALVAEKNVQSVSIYAPRCIRIYFTCSLLQTCHPLGGEWLPLSEVTPPVAPQHHTRVKQRRSAEKVGAHVRTLEPLERAIQALEEEMDSNIADLPLEQRYLSALVTAS